jgi:hypothetical protein
MPGSGNADQVGSQRLGFRCTLLPITASTLGDDISEQLKAKELSEKTGHG